MALAVCPVSSVPMNLIEPEVASRAPENQVEAGALAGAVGPDQANHFARVDVERHIVDGDQPTERLARRVHLQHGRRPQA